MIIWDFIIFNEECKISIRPEFSNKLALPRKEPMTLDNIRHYTVAAVSTYISYLSNPIIFYFTISSFKTYVDGKLGRATGRDARSIRDFSTRMSTLRGSITSGIANSSIMQKRT